MSSRADLGPKPRLGYTDSIVARAAEKRGDAAYLAACEADERAGAYAISGELVVMKQSANGLDPLFRPAEARALGPVAETVFLGLVEDSGRFGIALDPAVATGLKERHDLFVSDLRSIAMQGMVDPDHLAPLAEAKAMLTWHAKHRFCANCGARTEPLQAGWKRDCAACKTEHFPRTDPVVIMLAIDGDRCLLGRSGRFAANMWSALAGFVEPGETIEEAVRREMLEEAGIPCGRVTYFRSQPWPFPMSLMIGCHAEALASNIVVDHTELEAARWVDRKEAELMLLRRHPGRMGVPPPVAIAHHIIRAFVEEGAGVLR